MLFTFQATPIYIWTIKTNNLKTQISMCISSGSVANFWINYQRIWKSKYRQNAQFGGLNLRKSKVNKYNKYFKLVIVGNTE